MGGATVAASAFAAWSTREAEALPAVRFADDFAAVRNGPLDGRVSPTGHRWRAFGDGASAPMVVYNRAIGPPAGHVPGSSIAAIDHNPQAAAGYAMVDMGGVVSQVHGAFRWDRSSSVATALAFGAFDFGPDSGPGFPSLQGGANAHVAITPRSVEFAVFSMGVFGDYEVLVPRGGSAGRVPFRYPHVCNGSAVYRAYVTISGSTARIDMDGLGAPLVYQDPRIASVKASRPFWEYYSVAGGTNLPRFVRVSAQRA